MYRKIYTKPETCFKLHLMSQDETFSIRQMIELTGLSEFTIRGWENRHAAFSPRRSETGRREYSKSDVERALLLRELLKRGQKIGRIANFSNQKLKSLFENSESTSLVVNSHSPPAIVIEAMELLALQKWKELEDLIHRIHMKNASALIQDFFLPLLNALSVKLSGGMISVAQEHVLSSFLKEKIYFELSKVSSKKMGRDSLSKKRFVLAAPEGDYHEIGLLLAHLIIRSCGGASLYLGPHTPAQDLVETALRFDATHLLIVSTVSKRQGAKSELLSYVSEVQKKVGSQLRILLAGSQAPRMSRDSNSSFQVLTNFGALEEILTKRGGRR